MGMGFVWIVSGFYLVSFSRELFIEPPADVSKSVSAAHP